MYYPDQARYAKIAAEELGLTFVDLNEGNGYLFKIHNDEKSIVCGAGWVPSYPINNASSYGISRDKSHTKSALKENAIPVIKGRLFFASQNYSKLRNSGHELPDAYDYAEKLGYPVFCKPNSGARGDFAEIVTSRKNLEEYVSRLSTSYDSFLIEELLSGTEYRVIVIDDKPILYTKKSQPCLVGDGQKTLRELLDIINEELTGTGVSSFPISSLSKSFYEIDEILEKDVNIKLIGRQNLSVYGSVDLVDKNVPEKLASIAIKTCRAINLRLGAVDIFDLSRENDLSDLVIIETNGNPSLKAIEDSGNIKVIIKIWKSMLIELLEL